MPRYFTHYWTNRTWQNLRTEDGHLLNHTADNMFMQRGVQRGDHVYVVTIIKGQLYLLGKLVIDTIGDVDTIALLLNCRPDELWQARDQIIAAAATPTNSDRRVPLELTEQLRFQSGTETKGLFFRDPGQLHTQTLRNVRELTPASAQMLDSILPPLQAARSDQGKEITSGIENDERIAPMIDSNGTGMIADLHAYHQSIDDELTSIRNRIRQLIGDVHWLTDGEHKETIVRRVLRNHVPEIIRVGTGFVCYAGGKASNQMDILLTDTRKPTLFKDDKLVIVTADTVQAIIEVKTKQTSTQLGKTLTKLGDNAAAIRHNAQSNRCLVGLFVHDAGDLKGDAVLRALHAAANQQRERAVDFVAVGSSIFAQYSEEALRGKGGEAPLWYLYNINKLAPAYFISHFAWHSTEDRPRSMRFAWFPLEGEIRNRTHVWISLQTNQIQETDVSFEPQS